MKKLSLLLVIIATLLSNTTYSVDSDAKYREKLQNLHTCAGSFFFIATCLSGYFTYYQLKSMNKINNSNHEVLNEINKEMDTTNPTLVNIQRRAQTRANNREGYPILFGIMTLISATGLCLIAKSIWDSSTPTEIQS